MERGMADELTTDRSHASNRDDVYRGGKKNSDAGMSGGLFNTRKTSLFNKREKRWLIWCDLLTLLAFVLTPSYQPLHIHPLILTPLIKLYLPCFLPIFFVCTCLYRPLTLTLSFVPYPVKYSKTINQQTLDYFGWWSKDDWHFQQKSRFY